MKKLILITFSLIIISVFLTACGDKDSETSVTSRTNSQTSVSFQVDEKTENESSTEISGDISDEENSSEISESSESVSSKISVDEDESQIVSNDTENEISESENTDSGIEEENDTEYTVSAEEIESSLSGYESEIVGVWNVKYILDSNNEEVDGAEIYGSSFRHYGGTLTFNDDGTFLLEIGISADDKSTQGNFEYLGGSNIKMMYLDDSVQTFKRVTINGENAIAMPVERLGDIFTVYFTM